MGRDGKHVCQVLVCVVLDVLGLGSLNNQGGITNCVGSILSSIESKAPKSEAMDSIEAYQAHNSLFPYRGFHMTAELGADWTLIGCKPLCLLTAYEVSMLLKIHDLTGVLKLEGKSLAAISDVEELVSVLEGDPDRNVAASLFAEICKWRYEGVHRRLVAPLDRDEMEMVLLKEVKASRFVHIVVSTRWMTQGL